MAGTGRSQAFERLEFLNITANVDKDDVIAVIAPLLPYLPSEKDIIKGEDDVYYIILPKKMWDVKKLTVRVYCEPQKT